MVTCHKGQGRGTVICGVPMRDGIELFCAAIASLLRAPFAVLQLILLPSVARLLLDIWIERGLDPEAASTSVLYFLADVAFVAFVAVGWHRFSLLGVHPAIYGARTDLRRMARYGLEWVVLGIVIGLGLLALILPFLMLEYCCLPAGTLTRIVIEDDMFSGYFSLPAVLIGAVFVWLFTWLFFRVALSLPHLAIRQGKGPRVLSWRATAPLEPAVIVCAALATLGTLMLWVPSMAAYDLFPEAWLFSYIPPEDSYEPYVFSIWYLALLQIMFSIQVLCGAAILTEIYRRAVRDRQDDEPKDVPLA